jgi:predicted enzyme related to lactoylglutathione lyase
MYISVVNLVVDDLDRAIRFYTDVLGWKKTMDEPMGPDARWVTVAPSESQTAFALMPSGSPMTQEQAGGPSGVIMEVDDVFAEHDRLSKAGVAFEEPPRNEPWGGWAMFKDSEGNVHGLHSAPRG